MPTTSMVFADSDRAYLTSYSMRSPGPKGTFARLAPEATTVCTAAVGLGVVCAHESALVAAKSTATCESRARLTPHLQLERRANAPSG